IRRRAVRPVRERICESQQCILPCSVRLWHHVFLSLSGAAQSFHPKYPAASSLTPQRMHVTIRRRDNLATRFRKKCLAAVGRAADGALGVRRAASTFLASSHHMQSSSVLFIPPHSL